MKRIIERRIYDTATAQQLAVYPAEESEVEISWALYVKPSGELFMYCPDNKEFLIDGESPCASGGSYTSEYFAKMLSNYDGDLIPPESYERHRIES